MFIFIADLKQAPRLCMGGGRLSRTDDNTITPNIDMTKRRQKKNED